MTSRRGRNFATRRAFLKHSAVTAIAATPLLARAERAVGGKAPAPAENTPGVGHFDFFPLGGIRPNGWLERQMRIQADGLSGHLGETWADVGPNSAWLGGTGEAWERGPYYLDGLVPLAYGLDDPALKAIALRFIEWTLQSQRPDGSFGPPQDTDWWPRMVMLKALTQYQEATGDPRVIPFLDRYLRHQLSQLPARPLNSWGKFRWQDEVLTVMWLYRRTHETYLLQLAQMLKQQGHDWVDGFDHFTFQQPVTWSVLHAHGDDGSGEFALSSHGVNNSMAVKTGPVWSLVSANTSDRTAAARALQVLDTYHGLPNGMFSCDEHLAGRSPEQGSELCSVVETMFSLEQSLAITGDAALGDRLELLAFNALPAAFTDDMWAHQYNQQPNQVECSVHTKPWTTDGPESNLFGLAPHFGCCTANYHQGWPKFTSSLYLRSHDDGVALAAYAPSTLRTELRGTAIQITQETGYPFRGDVNIVVSPAKPTSLPLRFRIPEWAAGTTIQLNGAPLQLDARPGSFALVDRVWHKGDTLTLTFPYQPRLVAHDSNTAAVRCGALVFALPIEGDWLKLRQQGLTADWQVYPRSQWNFGLPGSTGAPPAFASPAFSVQTTTVGSKPFASSGAGVSVQVKARQIPAWRAEDSTAADLKTLKPEEISLDERTLTLIPYGAAKLRITAFPVLPPAGKSTT